jgi:hypothetical protein
MQERVHQILNLPGEYHWGNHQAGNFLRASMLLKMGWVSVVLDVPLHRHRKKVGSRENRQRLTTGDQLESGWFRLGWG